jgi:hypothetical protein
MEAGAAGAGPAARPLAARHGAEETIPTSIKAHPLAANLPHRNDQPCQIRIATIEKVQQRSTAPAVPRSVTVRTLATL